ncbi:MAG TPA: efflux RND transporter periplasmic adaptor subunit [Steroidobacteraceae bacterium]|nr:efflux RND transporter periplasmic adaptor subunit [Steroidobacteraceae bacterium]
MSEHRAPRLVAAIASDGSAQDRILEPSSPWRRRRPLIAAGLGVAAALSLLVVLALRFAATHGSFSRAALTVSSVERGDFVSDVEADGRVVARISPTLYARAPGIVTLQVHAGDAIRRGQALAVIDDPDLTSSLEQEEAVTESLRIAWQRAKLQAARRLTELRTAYEQAQIDVSTARRERDRSRLAYKLGAYPQLQADRAEDALEKAQFALRQAKMRYDLQPPQNRFDIGSSRALLDREEERLADVRRQVQDLTVRSPVDGRVGQVSVPDQAEVAKGAPLLTAVDLDALEVQVQVPESEAHELATGMRADLEGDGRHWPGYVSGISPEVVDGSVVARLRFAGSQPRGLRQSQRIFVRIFIARLHDVLMVDRGNFADQEGGGFAYVVHGDTAVREPVRIGAISLQKVQILGGVSAGDRIVTSGAAAFHDAERVRLSN